MGEGAWSGGPQLSRAFISPPSPPPLPKSSTPRPPNPPPTNQASGSATAENDGLNSADAAETEAPTQPL